VVADGEDGFLVDAGDIPGMAERALRVLADDALAARMGRSGRLKALDRFCASRIIPMYEAHYRRVLQSR
jgi:glycosyltransferase involved in cell wall biosynthesis